MSAHGDVPARDRWRGFVLSPIVAGFLLRGGCELPYVALMMSLGSLVAAGLIMMLKLKPEQPEAESDKGMGKAGRRRARRSIKRDQIHLI